MPLGHIRAAWLLHQTFHHYSPAQRLHILARFLSTPLLRTVGLIPEHARVLDAGAGHGLWARLAAEERASSVVAVEPDVRKLTRFHHPRVRIVAGEIECVRATFDVVTIFDVLYLMSSTARDGMLRSAFERLRPGGLLLVKDLDPDRRLKNAWDHAQERVAMHVLHLSRGEGLFGHDTRDAMAARLERAGFADVQWRRIDRWYPHAHIVYTAKRL